jgi:hypothetical protein
LQRPQSVFALQRELTNVTPPQTWLSGILGNLRPRVEKK